jgi:hypothetical protein
MGIISRAGRESFRISRERDARPRWIQVVADENGNDNSDNNNTAVLEHSPQGRVIVPESLGSPDGPVPG